MVVANFSCVMLGGQIEISEVSSDGVVELVNTGSATMDVSDYWLCNRPLYSRMSTLTLECGELSLEAGATVTVSGFSLNAGGDELGVYSNSNFGSASGLVDYVIWGERSGGTREDVAVAAGLWTLGARAEVISSGQSLNKDVSLIGVDAYSLSSSAICEEVEETVEDEGGLEINEISSDGSIEIINTSDDVLDISNYWLCNRPAYSRFNTVTIECGDLNLEPGESVTVSGFTVESTGDELGIYVNSSFGSASGLVDYVIWGERSGGTREDVAVAAGLWTLGARAEAISAGQSLNKDVSLTGVDAYSLSSSTICEGEEDAVEDEGGLEINEISSDGSIEIINTSDDVLDISNYWLCNRPAYSLFSTVTIECGDLNLEPGESVTVSGFAVESTGDELGIYVNSSFGSASGLVDYVIWGERSGGTREDVAVAAGLWTLGARAEVIAAGQSLNKDVSLTGVDAFSVGESTICPGEETGDMDSGVCAVNGGTITFADGGIRTSICIDGNPDPLSVSFTEAASGSALGYIITDDANNILARPMAPPFDLDGAGVGTCFIYSVAYEPGFAGAVVGNNIADITGCFDLSEPLTVYREAPDGGMVSLLDGSTQFAQCAGQITFDVMHQNDAQFLSYWYIITDDQDNIIDWVNSANSNTIDLSSAPAGTCRVWGWSYRGLDDPIIGDPISSLTDDDCEAISDNFITVHREIPDGGMVTLLDGSTSFAQCAGQIVFDVTHATTAPNLSYWYIITDANGIILDWVNSANSNTIDLSNAPAGECRVWGWNYRGLPDPVVGEPLSTLRDDFCEDVSDNFITVHREIPDGGMVTLLDGSTSFAQCAGQIVFDVTHATTAPNLSYWYIITDANGIILDWVNSANSNTIDLSNAPAGECRVWGWNYRGLPDPVVGEPLSTLRDDFCEDVSDDFITVYREIPDGGEVTLLNGGTTYEGEAGNIVFDVMHTTTAPFISFWYIITDDNNNILGWVNSANSNTLNLNTAPPGICRIWGWNYRGLPDPVVGEPLSTLMDDFCEDVSEGFITVIRNAPANDGSEVTCDVNGGEITFDEGRTRTSICVDGNPDPLAVSFTQAASGSAVGYIITDDQHNILARPMAPPFDLDGAGVGTCFIYSVAYEPGFAGAIVGNNISDITGCFDLSEPLTVYREAPDGGIVSLLDGSTSFAQCAGQVVFDVMHQNDAQFLSYWYIITDDQNNIIDWVNSANSNTIDVSSAPAGTCRVWGWSYRGLGDPIIGAPISSLTDDDCEAISDNFITVYREVPDGGRVYVAGGGTTYEGEAGNIRFDVRHETTAPFLSYWYIITDEDDIILDWVNSANSNTVDLSSTPAGTCRVWGWNYRGLADPVRGESLATLTDDFCEDISTNFIEVIRRAADTGVCNVEAGSLALSDGRTSLQLCAADGVPDLLRFIPKNVVGSYRLVVTNADDYIIALPSSNTINADGMSAGEYRVYVLAYDGVTGVAVGNNINQLGGCFDLSNPFVLDRILCAPNCQTPLNLRYSRISSSRFAISWDAVSNARGYEILIGFEGDSRRFLVPVRSNRVFLSVGATRPVLLRVRTVCGPTSRSPYTEYVSFRAENSKSSSISESTGQVYGDFVIEEPKLTVSPNPASDFIDLDFGFSGSESLLQIFDMTGRVMHTSVIPAEKSATRMSVRDFQEGIYQVIISSNNVIIGQSRFVKI